MWTFTGGVSSKTLLPKSDAQFRVEPANCSYGRGIPVAAQDAVFRIVICKRPYADSCLARAGSEPFEVFADEIGCRAGWLEYWHDPKQAFVVLSGSDEILDEIWPELDAAMRDPFLQVKVTATGDFSSDFATQPAVQPTKDEFEAGKKLILRDWTFEVSRKECSK